MSRFGPTLPRREASLPLSSPSEAALRVIPVVDLMGGKVVHARKGDRGSYGPLESPLSPTSSPLDVIRGLLSILPFPTLYIADLDAIQRHGDNVQTLRQIRDEFPALEVWVDNGAANLAAGAMGVCSGSW